MGLIFVTIGFIRNQFFATWKTDEKPISDLQEQFNPIKTRCCWISFHVELMLGIVEDQEQLICGFFYHSKCHQF